MRQIPEINEYLKKHYVTDATYDQIDRWLSTFYGPVLWSENEIPNKVTFEDLRDFTHEQTETWTNLNSQAKSRRKVLWQKLKRLFKSKKLIKIVTFLRKKE